MGGNEKFTKPQPNVSFCLAVAEHDNGWSEWELQPTLDAKTRLPFSFMSIPTVTHIALYQKGIERVVKVDHYAGLLASMHASVLYDRTRATMPGFSAKYVKNEESHIANEFVQQLRLQQQLRLKSGSSRQCGHQAVYGGAAHQCKRGAPGSTGPFVAALLFECATGCDCGLQFPSMIRARKLTWSFMAKALTWLRSLRTPSARAAGLQHHGAARPERIYASDADFQKTLAATQYTPVKLRWPRGKAMHFLE